MPVLNRRDFLTLRVADGRSVAEVSCEQLYMRWTDARAEGATGALFQRLAEGVAGVHQIRLVDTAWLADPDFRRELEMFFDGGAPRLRPR